jgi:hypothetical protein
MVVPFEAVDEDDRVLVSLLAGLLRAIEHQFWINLVIGA